KQFFHWKLEFPEVFFDIDTGKQKQNPGFDAVVGNPPYGKAISKEEELYDADYPSDFYPYFVELGKGMISQDGKLSYIVPTSWETGPNFDSFRKELLDGQFRSLINLPYDVFEDAYVDTCVFVWEREGHGNTYVSDFSGTRKNPRECINSPKFTEIDQSLWSKIGFISMDVNWLNVKERIENRKDVEEFGEITDSTRGVLVTEEALNSEPKDEKILNDSFLRYEPVEATDKVSYEQLKEKPPTKEFFKGPRLLIRRLVSRSDRLLGSYTEQRLILKKDVYIFKSELSEKYLLSLINSRLLSWWHFNQELSASKDDFRQVTLRALRDLPIVRSNTQETKELVGEIMRKTGAYNKINTNIKDYLGNYSDGERLGDICMPAEGRADTILAETEDDREGLKVERVRIEEDRGGLVLSASAKYKPEDEDEFDDEEFDRWGYVETDFFPAMRFDVGEKMEALIQEFVPVAVDNGDAGFKKKATSNISLINRLEDIQLPKLSDVEDDLGKFIENKEKAEELEQEIQETDVLIDAIVFDLYDLTEEEVETVLDSLDTEEDEKRRILEKFREQ
ncbi:MAG: Eco57I restriction-modification methylase domain-containing protein, partial [Candidatus Nanohaloarchaea archaeon]